MDSAEQSKKEAGRNRKAFCVIAGLIGLILLVLVILVCVHAEDRHLDGTWGLFFSYSRESGFDAKDLEGEAFGTAHAIIQFDGDRFTFDRIISACMDPTGALGVEYSYWRVVADDFMRFTGMPNYGMNIEMEPSYEYLEHVGSCSVGGLDRVHLEGRLYRVISSGTFRILENPSAEWLQHETHINEAGESAVPDAAFVIEFTLRDGRSGIVSFSHEGEEMRIGSWARHFGPFVRRQ